ARVIAQAPVLRAQRIAGAEVGQLHRARIAEIAVPVVLSSILATGTALMVISAVFGGAPSDPLAAVQYLVSVIAAYALVIAAVLVASPVVRLLAVRAAWAAVCGGAPRDPLAAVQYLVSVLAAYALVIAAVLVASPLVRRLAVRAA